MTDQLTLTGPSFPFDPDSSVSPTIVTDEVIDVIEFWNAFETTTWAVLTSAVGWVEVGRSGRLGAEA